MSILLEHIRDKQIKPARPENTKNKWIPFIDKTLKDKHRAQLFKDFGILLGAKVDFKTALSLLCQQQKKQRHGALIQGLQNQVIKGKALHQAMEHSGEFSPYEVFSIKIGEQTHRLETVLKELQQYFENKARLRKQILAMLSYPAFVLILTLATLYFMLNYVVPLFGSVFKQFDKDLPALTQFVMQIAQHFNTIILFAMASLVLAYIIYGKIKKNLKARAYLSRIILKIPLVGKVVLKIYLTRFCQSMSLLLSAKTPLVEALEMTQAIVGFYPITKALEKARNNLLKGIPLEASLKESKIFDHQLLAMVKVGESVNELDQMFLRLAEQYGQEVSHKTKIIGSIVEPLLILFIGSIVGLIMIAMYAPMFNLSEVLTNN